MVASRNMWRFAKMIAVLWFATAACGQDASFDASFEAVVDSFANQYCIECHDERKEKGDFRIDTLSRDLADPAHAIAWRDAIDLVKLGDMPPEKAPQPSAEDLQAFVDTVEQEIKHAAQAASESNQIQLRRLSHSALSNSVKDLLGTELNISMNLPHDPSVGGFDNMAATLGQSSEFMRVLQTNAQTIAKNSVVHGPDPRVTVVESAHEMGKGRRVGRSETELRLWSSRNMSNVVWPKTFKAPRAGVYRITLHASQINTLKDVDRSTLNKKQRQMANLLPPDRVRQVAIVATPYPADGPAGDESSAPPGRRVGYAEVGPEFEEVVAECALEKDETFYLLGMDCPVLQKRVNIKIDGKNQIAGELLRIRGVKIHGPLMDAWPPQVSRELLNSEGELSRRGLEQFLARAFRQPVTDSVVDLHMQIYTLTKAQGLPSYAAAQRVVESALCSSRFLYVRGPESQGDTWALASRLSYFLWNSTPDDRLLELASTGELLDPIVFEKQVRRLIVDPKSERFIKDFTGQWLGLRQVGAMLPDPKLYPEYDSALERAMREETESLFREILRTNAPVTDFLNPGYAMLNERLARHYGIQGVEGPEIRRVALPADSPRGGLLGHASMLTITSNGSHTSPVVRGVWVLENLLHAPPAPPPPDVEPIEPDVRGSTTVREMLAKHRDIPTCNECHRRIDPWGFGLENFNAIGAWRDQYGIIEKGKPVDATGKTASGDAFNGAVEMRDILVSQSDRFTHALAAKLLSHAVGHPTTLKERVELDDIVEHNMHGEAGFVDLLIDICMSQAFLGN